MPVCLRRLGRSLGHSTRVARQPSANQLAGSFPLHELPSSEASAVDGLTVNMGAAGARLEGGGACRRLWTGSFPEASAPLPLIDDGESRPKRWLGGGVTSHAGTGRCLMVPARRRENSLSLVPARTLSSPLRPPP